MLIFGLWLELTKEKVANEGEGDNFSVVPDISNIKMSQSYSNFEPLGSLGGGFKAEI